MNERNRKAQSALLIIPTESNVLLLCPAFSIHTSKGLGSLGPAIYANKGNELRCLKPLFLLKNAIRKKAEHTVR